MELVLKFIGRWLACVPDGTINGPELPKQHHVIAPEGSAFKLTDGVLAPPLFHRQDTNKAGHEEVAAQPLVKLWESEFSPSMCLFVAGVKTSLMKSSGMCIRKIKRRLQLSAKKNCSKNPSSSLCLRRHVVAKFLGSPTSKQWKEVAHWSNFLEQAAWYQPL